MRKAVRFTAEADSLNVSVLGPDAAPGTPEFDLFVKALVTEMTVKAGQKCTAIRRALVPAGVLDAVVEATSARLAKVTVGNPAAEGVRMGPLASQEQRAEVRRSLKALADAGRIVFGDPDKVDVTDADAERGAFLSPVKFGDELTVTLTCKQLTPRDGAGYGEVRWDADITRQDGESVARYDVLTLVAKRP